MSGILWLIWGLLNLIENVVGVVIRDDFGRIFTVFGTHFRLKLFEGRGRSHDWSELPIQFIFDSYQCDQMT